MNPMKTFQEFVDQYEGLYRSARNIPLGANGSTVPGPTVPGTRPPPPGSARNVLIFSPHPDDECIVGALALRLRQEANLRVINVAVTQGSKKERQAERWAELQNACRFIGFDLVPTRPGGLERVNVRTREQDPGFWRESVRIIAGLLREWAPSLIFFPHERDWNSSHIGTHWLVVDALRSLGPEFGCLAAETEYWGQNDQPNLMVQSSAADVAQLVAGIAFHIGEVRRNPFHLFLPAWMQENVRRGSELVGGQGEAAPDWAFATLYRLRRWRNGAWEEVLSQGRLLGLHDDPAALPW